MRVRQWIGRRLEKVPIGTIIQAIIPFIARTVRFPRRIVKTIFKQGAKNDVAIFNHSGTPAAKNIENKNTEVKVMEEPKILLDYKFEFVSEIQPERDENGKVRPYIYAGKKFCKFHLDIPKDKRGLYALYVDDKLIYIGQTTNLKSRWGSTNYSAITERKCSKGGQSTNCKVNNYIYQIASGEQEIDEIASGEHEIKLYFCEYESPEYILINHYNPPLNNRLKNKQSD